MSAQHTPGMSTTPNEREAAPPHSLPNWSECAMRVDNSNFFEKSVAEGGYGPEWDSKLASELHRFIYEYDDADPYRSAWFLHRLELVLKEQIALAAAGAKPLDDPRLQQLFGDCIEGALAFGFQGNNPPPEGHWLWRFWNIGRAEAAGAKPEPEGEAPTIAEVLEWAAGMATHEDPRTSDWYYDDPYELAKAIRKGPEGWQTMMSGTTAQVGNALLALSHQMDDEAQGITEERLYDFTTAIRMMLGLDGAGAVVAATPGGAEAFAAWLAREMPPGTVISDPAWWVPRILRAIDSPVPDSGRAEADTKRLDWLEAQDLNDLATIRQTNGVIGINVGHGPRYGKTLRAAIDSAMSTQHAEQGKDKP